jgi:hypothetical protein
MADRYPTLPNLSATDNYGYATGVAIDSSDNAYIAGSEKGSDFPTTAGAYQTSHANGSYTGFVAKFNPSLSGTASLIYSTLLGTAGSNGYLYAIAVDSSSDAYVTGNGATGFPISPGAFQYAGYYQGRGGVYVTKLNTTGTALVYSAYLGNGVGTAIAVDGQGNAYTTGTVGYADFPTTPGAYQTSYAGGFVTELNPTGTTELFSTFLGGPSSYTSGNVSPISLVLPPGCPATSPQVIVCTPYVSGWTSTTDFPAINAVESSASTTNQSGFIVQLAANGQSALFSSYLNGVNSGFSNHFFDDYGKTPATAVDSSGNISFVGVTYSTVDFPITIPTTNPTYGIFARIVPAAAALTFIEPGSVDFGTQPVGVSTTVDGGTASIRLSNFGSAAAAISSIQVSPSSIFSESDNCGTSLAGGGFCTLNLDFAPGGPGVRSGTVTVISNAGNSPLSIALSGTGQDQAYAKPSASSLLFAPQNVGTSSVSQPLTITNSGSESTALAFSLSTSDYLETNNCPSQLAAGASCVVNVTFKPTQAGLRTDNLYFSSTSGPAASVPLSGTGTFSGVTPAVVLSETALNFGPQAVGSSTNNGLNEYVYITNTGAEPVTIQTITTSGDYALGSVNCAVPGQLNPQASCYVYVNFAPTTAGARTGVLSFTDTAGGSPQTVALNGIGLATNNIDVYPAAAIFFADQAVSTVGTAQLIQLQNTGIEPVTVDRVVVSAGFQITSDGCTASVIAGSTHDGTVPYSTCSVYVAFAPTATGSRTGTLTFVDSAAGGPQVVTLSGNGLAPSGTLALAPTAQTFGSLPVGTTGGTQYVYLTNPGNTPITLTSVAFTGNFSAVTQNCAFPYALAVGQSNCYVGIQFSPSATGSLSGTITVQSSAGPQSATLTGAGVAATQTLQLSPSNSMTFGSIVTSNSGSAEYIYVQNTGSEAVTFSASPAVNGTNASDFAINSNSCGGSGQVLQPNTNCYVGLVFTPSATGARTAGVTFTDTATGSPQTVNLTGTGVSTTPTYSLSSYQFSYQPQLQGTTSAVGPRVIFSNNGTAGVTLQNVAITGSFIVTHGDDTCSGVTVASGGGSCYVYVQYSPSIASGNTVDTGTLTFKNSSGTTLITLALAGYSLAPVTTAYVDPTTLNFTALQVVGTTSAYKQITLTNTGNEPVTVGAITGTNLGVASATAEFSLASANGGIDDCSNTTVQAGGTCSIYPTFTPNGTGTRTGTAQFPLTYGNGTTATLTAALKGTGVAEQNSAEVSPSVGTFVDQAVASTSSYAMTATLFNGGNRAFTVAGLTGVNVIVGTSITGEFSTAAANGGSDHCTNATVQAGSYCQISVAFTPSATGSRTGSITLPVTFADHSTANPKLTLSGQGVASAASLQITPGNLQFGTEVQSQTTAYQTIVVTNTGNVPVVIGGDSISTNSADFSIYSDGCSNTTLRATNACTIYVRFNPSSTSTGSRTGVLTIADNSSGGPHSVGLSGIALTSAQQIVLAPTSLNFGNQVAGTTSPSQTVYGTNQGQLGIAISSVMLGGADSADFQMSNGCGYFYGHSTCRITVTFEPLSTSSGTRTATITETDTGTGSPRTISLSGVAVTAGPAVAFAPTAINFPSQNVGTTSSIQTFTITNDGSANLIVNNVSSSNSTEFPLSLDGCSGATLSLGQHCTVSIKFSPALGGTRTSTIIASDNATGSPPALSVTGVGYGIPNAIPNVSTITYANQNIGTSSAAQSVNLSNSGTDVLHIASVGLTGADAADFTISANSCGASLAPAASCTISATFKPTAAGTRGAAITITDNANNATGSTQNVALSGTGVAVPAAADSPTSLGFGNSNIGVATAAQTVTLTNSGSGPLTIASIAVGGTNAADFSETNSCGSSLPAAAHCTISVTFKPSAAGSRTGSVVVTDNSGNVAGSTQTATLAGTGVVSTIPTIVSLSPNSGSGEAQTFAAVYNDASGASLLTTVRILFNTSVNGSNGCYVLYSPAQNAMYLENNAGNGTSAALSLGSSSSVSNSQCTLSGAGSSVNISGNNMTVFYALSFTSAFTGSKNVYLLAGSNSGSSGWVQEGSYTPVNPAPPAVVSVTPNSGSGVTQSFMAVYSDPQGFSNLATIRFLMNTSVNAANGCYVQYVPSQNALYLENNAGNGTSAALTPGSSNTVSNNQCTLSGSGSSVTSSGNNMTVIYALTFSSTFTAAQNVYLLAGTNNASSGWVREGTWTP